MLRPASLLPRCGVAQATYQGVNSISFVICSAHYFLVQFSIFNPFILLKCFSLFVTKIEFIVSAVDAINKSKSSIGENDFLKICF